MDFNPEGTIGIFRRSWKESIVSPVLEAGKDATKPMSYRPISLLSNVSKVVEKVVHDQLIHHCLGNRITPEEQFGFLRCPETPFISHENANFLFSVFRVVQGEAKNTKTDEVLHGKFCLP